MRGMSGCSAMKNMSGSWPPASEVANLFTYSGWGICCICNSEPIFSLSWAQTVFCGGVGVTAAKVWVRMPTGLPSPGGVGTETVGFAG